MWGLEGVPYSTPNNCNIALHCPTKTFPQVTICPFCRSTSACVHASHRFGQVSAEGLGVIAAICKADTDSDEKPTKPIKVKTIAIR